MKGLRLVGAKIFLDMPKGTIYQRFWMNNEDECFKLIEDFKNNKVSVDWNEIEIYGNNLGSMAIDLTEDDFIFYYDANVVGDAEPFKTLYLIIEENYIPDVFTIKNLTFTKQKLLELKQKFINHIGGSIDNKNDTFNIWAREYLNNSDNSIINVNIK